MEERVITATKKTKTRINQAITAPSVRLVDPDGKTQALADKKGVVLEFGIVTNRIALSKAENLGMDLVEVSPNASPPVVRIMDFGKHLFSEKKKVKKQHRVSKIKEVKMRPVTDDGDYQVKLRNLISFLTQGYKVKVTVRFKGREIAHHRLGSNLLERIKLDVEATGQIDQMPKLEGRQMVMLISPKRTG